jgi:hypothetical protein
LSRRGPPAKDRDRIFNVLTAQEERNAIGK